MTWAWDKEKIWGPDENWTYDLSNTRWALYPLSYENSWRARSLNWVHSRAPVPATKRSPILVWEEKETHELIFSWLLWLAVLLAGAYPWRWRRRSCPTWRPYSKQEVDRAIQPWLTILWYWTSMLWLIDIAGSRLQLIKVTCFCEVDRWPRADSLIGLQTHVRLTCWKQCRIVL